MTKKKPGAKRGRPPTVEKGTNVLVYLPASALATIAAWAKEEGLKKAELLRAICVRAAKARERRKARKP